MYSVYLDDISFYGVESINESSDREVTVYNGVGQGNFPVADEKNLNTWNVSCELSEINDFKHSNWVSASSIFNQLNKLLETKDESRLVIVSEHKNLSERVLLESFSKSESYSGVYNVTLKFIEYKEASIKTTDIPYIPRPGKPPIPESVVFTKDKTVADTNKKLTGNVGGVTKKWYGQTFVYVPDGNNTMPIYRNINGNIFSNPNTIPKETSVIVDPPWGADEFNKKSSPGDYWVSSGKFNNMFSNSWTKSLDDWISGDTKKK